MSQRRGRRPPGRGGGGRGRPPKRWDSPPSGPGHGSGTRHTTGGCMLAKAVGAVILAYIAAMTGLTLIGAW